MIDVRAWVTVARLAPSSRAPCAAAFSTFNALAPR
jgi:hypothetical protein